MLGDICQHFSKAFRITYLILHMIVSFKHGIIAAGKNLTYTNLRRHILDSLEDKPFPSLPEELQKHIYFEFGSIEDHFKYRQAVMKAYPCGNYPVFEGYDHMQYQIREPKGFAEMLTYIAEHDSMHSQPFLFLWL